MSKRKTKKTKAKANKAKAKVKTSDVEFSDEVIVNTNDSESEKDLENIDEIENSDVEGSDIEDYSDEENVEDDDDLDDNLEIDNLSSEDDKKKKCFYKYADDNSESDDLDIVYDDENENNANKKVSNKERITKPILTKYERVRLIGTRTRQLALGAKPMIKNSENLSSKEIAELELKYNVMPLIVVRPIPNGTKEYWKIAELNH